jgi:arylsulfatase A
VPSNRFWQWNRYTPDGECNAAMRDGKWKLVRPAIRELMFPTGEDFFADVDSKYNPDKYVDIERSPMPHRERPPAPPPQLFDLRNDPFERVDLAAAHPERVSRMTNELAAWFEDVETDRRAIESES